ncbi:RNA cap guanine-N2 methyltransferase,S-adenosyl-L-methionine-dependent methyltransferase [Cinara cedri]|uniref:Trimethylguanosine synthase n=1 Tax=Cinara cedri TaxID=506608 RepID=A0A5E4NM15_9HEMI|nr:RNA cap guanine-N2 methyltransferase,S-adenosyl-L-methionine-dependent methyltransferase [Cinara cedri]
MALSYFSLSTEKLVEVFYEPKNCNEHNGVTVLCSRFTANYRQFDASNPLSIIENSNNISDEYGNSSDDEIDIIHLSKHILSTTIIEHDANIKKQYETESQKMNAVLEDIGLIIDGVSKFFTFKSQPSYMMFHKHNITSYSPDRNASSITTENSIDSSGSIKYNTERKWCTSTPMSSPNHKYKSIDEYRKYFNSMVMKHDRLKEKNSYLLNHNRKKINLKYWSKRHMLFSKFDLGILLDDESFYSVCPEVLSYHIAKRCQNHVVLDPFCGAGGNIIQLAFMCDLVIAIDIDPTKILFAKHNAEIYGVAEKIEFIVGDFFSLASKLKADVVFMSPPWGGPEYSINESFSIALMCNNFNCGGYDIFNLTKSIASNIAFHVPKTTNIFECLWLAINFGKVEIQQNIINGRLNSITAFYGEFTDITDDEY